MSDLPSYRSKIQTEATRFRSAVSESLVQDIGSSINYLIDQRDSLQTQVSTLAATGDTLVVFGNGSNQFPGAMDLFNVSYTFLANEYASIEFRANTLGVGGWAEITGGGAYDYRSNVVQPRFFGTYLQPFTLQLFVDSSVVNSVASADIATGPPQFKTLVTLSHGQWFFQPGAGTHTVRLYKTGSSTGVFDGQIIFKVHKHL